MNKAFAHIPFSTLVDFAEGRQPLDDQAEQHLAACPRCAGEFGWVSRTIDVMRTDESELPPAYVVARAKQLARRLPRRAGMGLRQCMLARLHFDSAQAPLAFGVRSGAARQRQLLFETEHHTIDLRLKPQAELWAIAGQVLGSDAGGHVGLAGPATASAELNATSEFSLPPVPGGRYTLTLTVGDLDIELPEIEIA